MRIKAALALGSSLAIAYGSPALAQASSDAATNRVPQAEEIGSSSEIIVTARRREESLSRVPISVSAFSQESLNNKSVTSIAQVAQSTPGLTFGNSGGTTNPQVVIRGQSRANIGDAAQPVLTYFQDVPLPYIASIIPTYDLASLQVLKGPQGTLFGRNSTSGALLVYSKEPTYNLEGYLMGGYGNYDRRQAEGAINVPIIDGKLALRVAGQRIKRDGYTKVVNQGGLRRDDINDTAFRISLLAEPTDFIRNVTVFDYFKMNRSGDGGILNYVYPDPIPERNPGLNTFYDCGTSPDCDIDLALARQQAAGPRKTYSNEVHQIKALVTGLSNTTTVNLGSITLKNIFGLRLAKSSTTNDSDATTMKLIVADQNQNIKQTSDEFQIQGDFFDHKLSTILGAFYLKSKPNGPQGLTLATFYSLASPSVIMAHRTQTSKALFGQATYDFSDLVQGLKLDLGVRHTWDETQACAGGYPANNPFVPKSTPQTTLAQCVNGTSLTVNGTPTFVKGALTEDKSAAWTWNVGLNYQASDAIFLYATLRRGYRSGGVNAPLFNPLAPNSLAPFQSYAPETVTDIELGAKTHWQVAGMRGTLNLDVFRGRYKGSQRGINGLNGFDGDGNSSNDPSAGTIIVNAGNATVQGFDIDATISPMGGLTIGGFASYNDAKYTSTGIPPLFNTPTFAAFPTTTKDTAFPYAPALTLGANVTYEARLPDDLGSLVFNADVFRSSRVYFGPFKNDKTLSQAAYAVVNTRIDWRDIGGSSVDVGFFARNLFNKLYRAGAANSASSAGFNSVFYAEPRMYGVDVKISF
ncbi:iron complex outermembrane receptor protein [Sphingobium wenxiniae]|uniref:Iron complex outermembrane receptor protein n=1 Tax=Sphingobium wenxiniae (strain DSM 21828 / CGMCC 1.7748 / JZ-1) TaxID=595605 RepID=A0A562K1Z6_SPHWJ|nr:MULTISPECIES: TonB-dependent receptor [Sphingobium]MBB6193495.1 iron complex outermembrane receptor protein [Sphingobium wenxiniae]TWH89449.1 iron complex outermembrane receptor protein [Sphingobium wenxiniae]WRD77852.1 TonB-dependent receptor [Sphingobium baderi]